MPNHTPKHHNNNLPLLEFNKRGYLMPHVAKRLFELGYKYCQSCNMVKSVNEFNKCRSRPTGLQPQCAICGRIATAKWQANNREHRRAYAEKWREQNPDYHSQWYLKNKEDVTRKQKEWVENNPKKNRKRQQRWYRDNKKKRLDYGREWRRNNPEKAKVVSNRRRARQLQAEGSHTSEELKSLWKQQGGRCVYCGCKLTTKYRHLDHVIPLSRGGTNWISNLAWACPSCNSAKGNKLLEEWLNG